MLPAIGADLSEVCEVRSMSLLIAAHACRWPELRIPFVIDQTAFPSGSANSQIVNNAITAMNNQGGTRLFPRIRQSDYVEFRAASSSCTSPVGRQGGCQPVRCNVGSSFGTGSVMHEICHAIGFYHEHQRPDRDDFLSVDEQDPNYTGVNHDERDDAVVVDNYDFGSIMHYGIGGPISLKSGVPPPSGVVIGQRNVLSAGDIQALKDMKSGMYLGSTYDKSGAAVIDVQSTSTPVAVAQGELKKIIIPNYRFWWLSYGSREWTTAPRGTNVVVVYRERGTRNINWACYKDPTVTLPRFLGNEYDKCDSSVLRVRGVNGYVQVSKGETKRVPISSRNFEWLCGDSRESSVAPPRTNVVMVTRASRGRDVIWACYRE